LHDLGPFNDGLDWSSVRVAASFFLVTQPIGTARRNGQKTRKNCLGGKEKRTERALTEEGGAEGSGSGLPTFLECGDSPPLAFPVRKKKRHGSWLVFVPKRKRR
jgi:hypothetical protein